MTTIRKPVAALSAKALRTIAEALAYHRPTMSSDGLQANSAELNELSAYFRAQAEAAKIEQAWADRAAEEEKLPL